MSTPLLVLLVIIAVAVIYYISLYNKIIRLQTTRENAFSDIDVQMKMRFDLVDNLVNTVKGYAKHEKSTLNDIIEARNKFATAKNMKEKADANNQVSSALKSIFALAESYPDLKANQNFLQLQNELSDIENKIAAARRFFNATTKEYNTTIQQFPANVLFHKTSETFFEGEEVIKKAPKVEF
ncbi:MAG: LemA family protein [Candidatus Peribacteria bacterium]|jgi:LemA protein|nr:LemA family protein [Candidatus Peribacteria bacterium]